MSLVKVSVETKNGLTMEAVKQSAMTTLQEIGDKIVASMEAKLADGDHIDTGELINSIRAEVKEEGDTVVLGISIDAVGVNGAWYAEFLEYGSGKYREGGGRLGGWYYVYRGNKMTPAEEEWLRNGNNASKYGGGVLRYTEGIKADPFIQNSVDDVLEGLDDAIRDLLRQGMSSNTVRYHL